MGSPLQERLLRRAKVSPGGEGGAATRSDEGEIIPGTVRNRQERQSLAGYPGRGITTYYIEYWGAAVYIHPTVFGKVWQKNRNLR